MENLEEWIFEEDKVVTYKYLSRSLKVHVNVAKQMLSNFYTEKKAGGVSLQTVYLVSGKTKGEESLTTVSLVKGEGGQLEELEGKLATVLSKHLYSLQKPETPISFTTLYATDLEVLNEDPISC